MASVSPLLCPLLVGRDDLLDLADRRLADAAGSRGQFLLLAGEAGVGKSRLIAALRRKAASLGFMVAEGDLAPQDRIVPGALIQDLVRNMLKIRAFDRLGDDFMSLPDALPGMQFQSRRVLVHDLVDRIAESLETPVLLVIEDLQWADDLSLEIVAELARRIRDRPVLLVGAYRTDELPTGTILRAWRARLLTQRMAEEARLAPLTIDQTALMTTLILSTGLPAPREVVAAVQERTDGIPLHIEELLGALSDEARSDGRAIREATVPATIEDAVLARFEHLSPEGRAVAQAGAVIGRCFVPEVLAGIMDLPLDALETPLQELVDQAFLYPFESADVGFFDFRHQLLRDVLYQTVPRNTLRRLHARAGEFGAQLEGASEIHASAHFERAGLRPEAFRAALSGAGTAARLSSHRDACELYRRAVRNMPVSLDLADQGALYEAYAQESAAIELNAEAEEAARTARDRYLAAGNPVGAARMLLEISGVARREGRSLAARMELITQGLGELETVETSPDREVARAALLAELAATQFDAMELGAATKTSVAARDAVAQVGAPTILLASDALDGMIDVQRGDIDEGLAKVRKAAREARTAGFEAVGVSAYRDAVTAAVRVMRYASAEDSMHEGLRWADAIEQSHCRHVMSSAAALIEWTKGHWDASISDGALEVVEKGCRRGTIGAEVAVGYVLFGRGDLDQARTMLDGARAAGEHSATIELILPALWGQAETAFLRNEPDLAAELCCEAFERAAHVGERGLFVPFVVTGVRSLIAAGQPEAAQRWTSEVEEFLQEWDAVARPALDHARGLVRLAHGSTSAAREALEAAVIGWTEVGRIWESTWARVDLAAGLLRSNRYADAAGQLLVAREVATRLSSTPLLLRIDELAAIAHRHGTFDEPWRPLTAREFEVARHVANGLTNGEIASELSIATKTASAHVEHILAKLGVARRAEIASWVATVPSGAEASSRGSHHAVIAGAR